MIDLKVKLRNIKKFYADIKKEELRVAKAAEQAVRIEGFRLKELLQEEIMSGSPGGHAIAPMKEISKLSRTYETRYGSQLWGRTKLPAPAFDAAALYSFAIPIRYWATKTESKTNVKVGITRRTDTSASWRKTYWKQATGFTIPLAPQVRKWFATWPKKMATKRKPMGIYFPKEKTHLTIPARPVVDLFWRTYAKVAYKNIVKNFEAKMAGKNV